MAKSYWDMHDISIHAAREGGDCMVLIFASNWVISIHAAREGGDSTSFADSQVRCWISIHAAREGGDHSSLVVSQSLGVFQSTPPVKAAT